MGREFEEVRKKIQDLKAISFDSIRKEFVADSLKKETYNSKPDFRIDLPLGYEREASSDDYTLLTAAQYSNDEIQAMIELRYSDDWSFGKFSTEDYIQQALKTDEFEKTSSLMFKNFNIHTKERMYFKNLGYCFYSIYSGDYYSNDVRVTDVVVQFIKDDKLFTLIGSSFPETFSENHKHFLKSFETLRL
jgi:ABC-type antimicrobial peptide transport system permease subunit